MCQRLKVYRCAGLSCSGRFAKDKNIKIMTMGNGCAEANAGTFGHHGYVHISPVSDICVSNSIGAHRYCRKGGLWWRDWVVNKQWFRGQRTQQSVPGSTRSGVEDIDCWGGYRVPLERGYILAKCNATMPAVISPETWYHNACGYFPRS